MIIPKCQNYEIPSLKKDDKRVETGPVSFNFDWPGLFIRGDTCHALLGEFCYHMRTVVEKGNPEIFTSVRPLVRIVRLLASPVGYSKTQALYVKEFLDLLEERLSDLKWIGKPLFDPAEVTKKTLIEVEKTFQMFPELQKMPEGNKKDAKIRGIIDGLIMAGKVPWWTIPTWRTVTETTEFVFGIPGDPPVFVVKPFDNTKKKEEK